MNFFKKLKRLHKSRMDNLSMMKKKLKDIINKFLPSKINNKTMKKYYVY